MNINGIVEFLHAFFYKTFEILPILGNYANFFFIGIIFILFLYWISVLAKTPKTD
jgi:hypothetical protein